MTVKEALELYKSRDASEKLFKADKTFLGNRSSRVYSSESLVGKMRISFSASIIRNRYYTKLKNAVMKIDFVPNYMNVPAAIKELEKIEMIRQADGVYRLVIAKSPFIIGVSISVQFICGQVCVL